MKLILQGTQGKHPAHLLEYLCQSQLLTVNIESDSNLEQVYSLISSLMEEDLLYLFAINLHRLPFESRKDAQVIFSNTLRFRSASPDEEPLALSYVIQKRPQILKELCRCYDHKESATPAGTILREMIKHESAAAIILYENDDLPGSSLQGLGSVSTDIKQSGQGIFWRFFEWVDKASFEVGADAFTTFRVRPPPETRVSFSLTP